MKKTTKGDLIHLSKLGHFDLIVHGQNCFHGWKKGIAHSIGLNFPEAKKADLLTRYGDKKKLGGFSHAIITLECGKPLIVVNAYTQFEFGKGINLNLNALKSSFIAIAEAFPDRHIAYPKVGSGHAGGNWKEISSEIDSILINRDHTLVVF